MAEIPAPLASRHTALAVVVASVLGAVAAIVTLLVPIGEQGAVALFLVRQAVFTLQSLVLALGVVLVWRTLARRSRLTLVSALAATAGFALLALAQLAGMLVPTAWGTPELRTALAVAFLATAVLVVPGLLGLGAAVLRAELWHGVTRITFPVAALASVGLAAAAALDPQLTAPLVYTVWSLLFLGLAVGLRSRRAVANAGVPQGAASFSEQRSA